MKICRENCHQINHDPAFFSAPCKYSTTVVLSRSMRFVNGHWPRKNHPDWLLRKPIWFNQLIKIANFSFFSVRYFNVTVLLHCELYTGFLQRINQFSSSVKFANGYYENQLTYSNRWWYFYMSEIYVWSMNNIFVTVRGLKSNDYVKFHRLSQYTKQTNLPHDVSYLCFSLPAMKLVLRRELWWTDQRNKIMVTSDNHVGLAC